MSYGDVNNSEDILDSRQVIERIEELRDGLPPEDADDQAGVLTGEECEELRILEALAQEGEDNVSDWRYGETLVRDDYFETYAQDLAEDLGYLQREATWPYNHIDWEAAAEELQQDYVELDFDGVTYWARM